MSRRINRKINLVGTDEINRNFWRESIHTKISYTLAILAFSIQFFIGIRNIGIDPLFGQLVLLESFFALSGILFLDLLHGKRAIYPKQFKPIHKDLFIRFAVIFGIIALIQFVFQYVPISVRESERALAIVFAGVSEEFVFRGILQEPFFRWGIKDTKLKLWGNKVISYADIFGILISGTIFAIFHFNYYDNLGLGLMVIVGGFWLGFTYFYWKDITAVIFAHVLLNVIFVLQTYWLIVF